MDKTPFTIHAKILSDNVPILYNLLQNDTIEIPDQDPEAVELLIEYCYTSHLPQVTGTTTAPDCLKRMWLYCLAEKNEHHLLMNNSIDFLIAYLQGVGPSWPLDWCTEIYRHTHPTSPLRRLLSKYFGYKFMKRKNSGKWTTEHFTIVAFTNPDLALDLFRHVRPCSGGRKLKDPKDDPASDYYVGPEGTFNNQTREEDHEVSDQEETIVIN